MFSQVDWRRVAAGGGVLVLHLLILLLLLKATGLLPNAGQNAPKEILLTLSPPPRPASQILPQVPEQIPIPFAISPRETRPITVPPEQQNSQPRGDIRDIGRYLQNCSGTFYEQLSPAERKNCLLFKNTHNGENAPVLGEAKPSPFDKVIQDRNAPLVPAFKQCDQASVNASLHNVPCTNFTGGHNLLEMNPGH